jgi:hypothetical protein
MLTSFERSLVTVTVALAVFAPSWVVAVMVAVPTALAVTLPVVSTVATAVLLDVQLTVLLVAFAGDTVAVKLWILFGAKVTLAGLMEMLATAT